MKDSVILFHEIVASKHLLENKPRHSIQIWHVFNFLKLLQHKVRRFCRHKMSSSPAANVDAKPRTKENSTTNDAYANQEQQTVT